MMTLLTQPAIVYIFHTTAAFVSPGTCPSKNASLGANYLVCDLLVCMFHGGNYSLLSSAFLSEISLC